MRGRALGLLALLVLSGCTAPAQLQAPPEHRAPDWQPNPPQGPEPVLGPGTHYA
ncbi:MAG: hypothetical protein LC624_00200 [Halobacteriales archaeon]|nr:hypothetical protein [Halobacteriales archaeon]